MNIRKKRHQFVLIAGLFFAVTNSFAAENPQYQQYVPSTEGTGKVYMGREIAYVMGYQGAAWLERENRQKEERTDVLIKSLHLKPAMIIADIGAGTGFLSRKMAPLVGANGIIYAVDVQSEMLSKLKNIAKSYSNIKPTLARINNVNLPANSLDLAIMVDVYHELEYPFEVVQSIIKSLKPHGKLVLVEYRAEDNRVPIKQTHKMTEAQVIKELTAQPLKWDKTINILPWQHIVVFSKIL